MYEKCHCLFPRLGMVDDICAIHVWLQWLVSGLCHFRLDCFYVDKISSLVHCYLLIIFNYFFIVFQTIAINSFLFYLDLPLKPIKFFNSILSNIFFIPSFLTTK